MASADPQKKPEKIAEQYTSVEYLKSQIPIFLQRERDLRNVRRQHDRVLGRLLALQKVGTLATIASRVEEGAELAATILVSEIGFEKAVIVLMRGEKLEVAAAVGYDDAASEATRRLSADTLGALLDKIRASESAVFADEGGDIHAHEEFASTFDMATLLLAPLVAGRPIGFVIAGFSGKEPDRYKSYRSTMNLSEGDTAWFSAAASQITSMISNLELIANLKHQTGELEKLNVNIKERTEELTREHTRLLASINSLPLGFMLVDEWESVALSNSALLKLFDLTHAPTKLHDIENLFRGVFSVTEEYEKCLREEQIAEIPEAVFGSKFFRIFFSPVAMARAGEAIGVVMLFEDITEQKALERGKEEFFSIASHELRTPLTVIRGNILLLRDFYNKKSKEKNTEAQEIIEEVLVSSDRLIRMVNDFLDVSGLEQKKIRFKKDEFDVVEFLRLAVMEFRPLTREKGLTLTFTAPKAKLPKVQGDKDRAEQILMNLLGNALKYTTKGGITLRAKKMNGFIKIFVEDTGAGIPPVRQSLLFRKFQQAGKDILARDVSQGTGLGLYIAKLIVEAMGGSIALEESKQGKGSVFSFTLPTAKDL